MEDINKEFGKFIRQKRKNLNITQVEAARRCGISQAAYQRYEAGLRDVDLPRLMLLEKALGFRADEFFMTLER